MTKLQKSRIIFSTLYNLQHVCIQKDGIPYNRAVWFAHTAKKEAVAIEYEKALGILLNRSERDQRDYIAEFVEQVNAQ